MFTCERRDRDNKLYTCIYSAHDERGGAPHPPDESSCRRVMRSRVRGDATVDKGRDSAAAHDHPENDCDDFPPSAGIVAGFTLTATEPRSIHQSYCPAWYACTLPRR